jgi:hypothetical protein
MEDLSLHVLDIVENATAAGATQVEIGIQEDPAEDLLSLTIVDNGRGMDRHMLEKARDPFVTTRTTRRVGLGLPFLEQATREAGGDLSIESRPNLGTRVKATFQASHIDRKPLGDMGSTLISLISGNPDVDFIYHSQTPGERITLDTREIRAELQETVPLNHPAVLDLIKDLFQKGTHAAEAHQTLERGEPNVKA